jgi:molybdopterin-guanine dinucleotide biosynthesis protein A
MNLLGVVLAGGASQRLGSDKAELRLKGEPLWQRQLDVLRKAGASRVVLVRRPGQAAPPGVECWRDGTEGAGPLRGLRAALAPRLAPWVAVLAVDMPGINPAWFRWLGKFCGPGIGAMACHPGAYEPLAAIYPAEALEAVESHLAGEDQSLQSLAWDLASAGRMILRPVTKAAAARLTSINTPLHLDFWKKRLGTGSLESAV